MVHLKSIKRRDKTGMKVFIKILNVNNKIIMIITIFLGYK